MGKFGTFSFANPVSVLFVEDLLTSSNFSVHVGSGRLLDIPDVVLFNADGGVCGGNIDGVVLALALLSPVSEGLVVESGQLGDLWLHLLGSSRDSDFSVQLFELLLTTSFREF